MPATGTSVRCRSNDAMAQLEAATPIRFPAPRPSLDAIALIDAALLAPPPRLTLDAPPPERRWMTKVSRKGALPSIPEQLRQKSWM